MHKLISQLLIICLVLGSISPACKFISGGQGLFEICVSDGEAQAIEIPAELLAFLPQQDEEQAPEDTHPNMNDDCAFCFAQSHFSAFLMDAPIVDVLPPVRSVFGFTRLAETRPELRLYQPRGPPAFLV